MSHDALRWLHVLAFALWFGTDLGVFTASLAVTNRHLSVETRRFALRLLMALDLVPRLAMLAVVAVGPWLAQPYLGNPWPSHVWPGWWLAIVAWGWLVVRLHHGGLSRADGWRRVDFVLRLLLIGTCLLAAAHPLVCGVGAWLSLKLVLLATAVACGLAVRGQLVPFIAAFGQLATAGSSPETESVVQRSMGRARWFVLGIYFCVLCAAWLGIAKPGWS